jgi:hypothetical protein
MFKLDNFQKVSDLNTFFIIKVQNFLPLFIVTIKFTFHTFRLDYKFFHFFHLQ